jgi:hypothetical protein
MIHSSSVKRVAKRNNNDEIVVSDTLDIYSFIILGSDMRLLLNRSNVTFSGYKKESAELAMETARGSFQSGRQWREYGHDRYFWASRAI